MTAMLDLFNAPLVAGLSLRGDFLSAADETALVAHIDAEILSPFKFQQWTRRRLTRSYGWSYNFESGSFSPTEPIPDWLQTVKARAAEFAGLRSDDLVQALHIRYDPGAAIGWHKDRPVFEHVVGISLGNAATLRCAAATRPALNGPRQTLAPRSIYHLSGEVRHQWEHSIAAMDLPFPESGSMMRSRLLILTVEVAGAAISATDASFSSTTASGFLSSRSALDQGDLDPFGLQLLRRASENRAIPCLYARTDGRSGTQDMGADRADQHDVVLVAQQRLTNMGAHDVSGKVGRDRIANLVLAHLGESTGSNCGIDHHDIRSDEIVFRRREEPGYAVLFSKIDCYPIGFTNFGCVRARP